MKSALIAALLAMGAASAVHAAPAKLPEASIPFANHHGIWDWRATDDSTLYVQDVHRTWYRASLLGPCANLPWSHSIGFQTGGLDTFDRYSSVVVEGQRCPIYSVVRADPPSAQGSGRKG